MLTQRTFSLRRDLVIRPLEASGEDLWVVLDPLGGRYYYFDDHEHAILLALDGRNSVATVCEEFSRRFAPRLLTPAGLLRFLGRLAECGLLLGSTTESMPPAGRDAPSWGRFLAWRLPGINPTRLLEAIDPLTRGLFTPFFAAIYSFWLAVGLVLGVAYFEEFVRTFPELRDWATPDIVWATVAALALTKVVHELGHALMAHRLGARCESVGVLLLFFVPCLYCDVSRAWLLPRRRDRILVSAAGMLAELGLATVALLAWTVVADGPARLVLAVIVVLSSINTVLVNGNPLMRYDGYYILSDLLGIPNLAAESSRVILQSLEGGSRAPHRSAQPGMWNREIILWVYGLAAGCWRLAMVLLIAYGFLLYFENLGLGSIGSLLAVLVLVMGVIAPLLRFSVGSGQRRGGIPWRVLVAGGAILTAALWIPLPRRVDAPFRVELRNSQEVYVTVPGDLAFAATPGSTFAAGDLLAELRSPEVQRELAVAQTRLETLQSRRAALEARRSLIPEADELPTLEREIVAMQDRLRVLNERERELRILSPAAGMLFSPPDLPPVPLDDHEFQTWSGTPLEPRQQGVPLQRGTLLGEIGDSRQRQAVLYVSQRSVRLLKAGQTAKLWLGDGVEVRIEEISPAPISDVPRELAAKELLAVDRQSSAHRPREPVYRVKATFLDPAAAWPVRMSGRASVRVAWTTLYNQLSAFVLDKLDV